MAVAKGIKKITSFKKQTGLGVPASGTGGTEFRRTSTAFKADRDMYESTEIVSHHMSTGSSYGLQKSDGTGDFELSPGTFSDLIGSLLERNFAAVSAVSGLTLTVAGPNSITRVTGSFLTDGLKQGSIIRLGGMTSSNNNNNNLLVTAVGTLTLTVKVLSNNPLVLETSGAGAALISFTGKSTWTPLTGHTEDYYSVEEWYSDLNRSELFTDMKVGSMSLNMPATGNITGSFGFIGLGRTTGTSQVLTTPTTTTTGIMSAINGYATINGVLQTALASFTMNVEKSAENSGAVIGSNFGSDVSTGRIKITGTITAKFDSTTILDLIVNETAVPLTVCATTSQINGSSFVAFVLPKVKLYNDAVDDGEMSLTRTYNFTAEYNSAGSEILALRDTIMEVFDSAA